ncbi:MAG TPA: amidohydrolase family protein [Vicinamibacterales bacterium]|nr:amidohydrolase family protein [Vicinamibacterales bacterium]
MMFRAAVLAAAFVVFAATTFGQAPVTVFDGARILDGNGGTPVDSGRLVVQGDRILAVGPSATTPAPAGATRVDLAGKTIMPAMINVHSHMGFEGYTTWQAKNHTAANLLDHLQREAFYGVAAVASVGTSPTEMSLQFQRDQRAGKVPLAARYLFLPGMAPPNGGPDHILREATNEIRVVNEVTTPEEARAAIQKMAGQGIRHLKMWVDDRRGTYPKLTPEVYTAIVREAHVRKITVHAHAIQLADQKAVIAAGADVLVHMVQSEPIDEAYQALLREKRPYWSTVISLGDPVEVCNPDPFFEEALPPSLVAKIRATKERISLQAHCAPPSPNAPNREKILAHNFPLMIKAGVKLVLATDTGIHPGHTFGSGEHVELARWVQLGLPPAEAIVAATKTPAELMGLTDLGTLTPNKKASFVVLDANPLDNIRNTRTIADVYLDGVKFDREAIRARWRTLR